MNAAPLPALATILDDVWVRLARGVADRRSPLHTPVVATVGQEGPRQRTMVLRGADRAASELRFHTDRRAAKVAQIAGGARASVLVYDIAERLQITLSGVATMIDSGPVVEAAWAATALSSRRAYLADPAPGTPVDHCTAGLPEMVRDRSPSEAETLPARANFALMTVAIDRIDWLELTSGGNRRACFTSDGGLWCATWLIP